MEVKGYNTGTTVLGVLQIIFIVLKCFGLISWSWWAVLIPIWISLALTILGYLLIAIGASVMNR